VRFLAAGVLAAAAFLLAGAALSAGPYTDSAGDDNAAPDITSVSVSEVSPGAVTVTVTTSNELALPRNAWFNLWFDLDDDRETGLVGSDALVRYLPNEAPELYIWNGSTLVRQPATDVTGVYENGALTMSIPDAALGRNGSFGIGVVSARRQLVGAAAFTASDFAPSLGHFTWSGSAQEAFADPENDHEVAPDITAVQVTESKDEWLRFAISTPNYETLRDQTLVVLSIDTDNRAATGEYGAEVTISSSDGEVQLFRWDSSREWVKDDPATRVRSRNAAGVVTFEVHRSELGNPKRVGFRVTSASIDSSTGRAVAFDQAPNSSPFWRYALTNIPAVRLVAGKAFGTTASARAGEPFAVSLPVRRSDTGRRIASGSVVCRVRVGGRKVRAMTSVVAGSGRCSFVVPASAAGKTVRGSITVLVNGKSVTAHFSYAVR
jgi:hypothetical protein